MRTRICESKMEKRGNSKASISFGCLQRQEKGRRCKVEVAELTQYSIRSRRMNSLPRSPRGRPLIGIGSAEVKWKKKEEIAKLPFLLVANRGRKRVEMWSWSGRIMSWWSLFPCQRSPANSESYTQIHARQLGETWLPCYPVQPLFPTCTPPVAHGPVTNHSTPSPIVNIAMGPPFPYRTIITTFLPPSLCTLYFCIQTVLYFKCGMVRQYLYNNERHLWLQWIIACTN